MGQNQRQLSKRGLLRLPNVVLKYFAFLNMVILNRSDFHLQSQISFFSSTYCLRERLRLGEGNCGAVEETVSVTSRMANTFSDCFQVLTISSFSARHSCPVHALSGSGSVSAVGTAPSRLPPHGGCTPSLRWTLLRRLTGSDQRVPPQLRVWTVPHKILAKHLKCFAA